MSEIPALFAQRPIILRHQKAAMYHPLIEALAMTLVDIPITFITIGLYTLIVYFIVGLQRSVGQFLYVSSLFLITLVSDVFGCLSRIAYSSCLFSR